MKRFTLFMLLLTALPFGAMAYDFYAAYGGNRLYYTITDPNQYYVAVCSPTTNGWGNNSQPTGALEIPSTVSYGGHSYQVTEINESVFSSCYGLTSVSIGNSVTTIGKEAFRGCTGLTSVSIGNSVTTIGNQAFFNCYTLSSLTIGNSVTTIGTATFRYCSSLTSIEIPNSVTTIGEYAFENCSGLTSVTIPNSVTSIGSGAFSNCSGLTSVTILSNAFASANYTNSTGFRYIFGDQVTSYTLGSNVTAIGNLAFNNCTGLTSLTVMASTPPTLGTQVFHSVPTNIPVYVLHGSLEAYQTYNNGLPWGGFTNFQGLGYDNFPFVDNFATASGWQFINGDLTNKWVWGEAVNRGDPHIYISDDSGNHNQYTITSAAMVYAAKLFHFEEGWYRFQYDWLANGEENYDYLRVALVPASVTLSAGTNPGFTTGPLPQGWIALDGFNQLSENAWWQTNFSEINVPTGDYMMVFAWRNDDSDGEQPPAAIDNVSIRPVTCLAPVELTAQHVGRSQVSLDWTPVGNENEWRVWLSWYNGNETEYWPYTATTHPFTITELVAGRTYTATVHAICGPDNASLASNEISFTTSTNPCDDPVTFPFTENFDGYESSSTPSESILPDCWGRINTTTVSSEQIYPTIINYSYAQSAPNFLSFMSTYYANTQYVDPQDQYAILPAVENVSYLVLNLSARISSQGRNGTFMVGVMTDPEDASTFTEIATCQPTTTTYTQYSIPLNNYTGNGWYIAIKMPAASPNVNYRGLCIDDVSIDIVSSPNIEFADPAVKALCVAPSTGWDTNHDGELSYAEAAAVTSLKPSETHLFKNNTTITSFNELQYFTGLTSIEIDVFMGCASLASVTLPSTITQISNHAFDGCTSLVSIIIPSMVTNIGPYAFNGCTGLNSIIIQGEVTNIRNYAFQNCTRLTFITVNATTPPVFGQQPAFGNVPTDIPVYVPCNTKTAYQNASGWSNFTNYHELCEAITFADANVKAICVQHWDTNGDGELSYAEAAAVTTLNPAGEADTSPFYNTSITSFDELQYFTGLTTTYAALKWCSDLVSVVLPSHITSIDDQCFISCWSLASITIPSGVTSIGVEALYDCRSLTSIVIPSGVTSIGAWAFNNCSGLTSITIPESVNYMGENPFMCCTSLVSIIVDEDNIVFDSRDNCNAIIKTSTNTLAVGCKNTVIPATVTSIGLRAFQQCSGLTSIAIPNSVNHIGGLAFIYCTDLTTITVLATTPPAVDYLAFDGFPNTIPVYVPCESLEAYQTYNNGQPWGGFTNIRCDGCSAELPISENFDSYQGATSGATNVLPDCWSRFNTAVDIAYRGYPTILNEPANAYSGSNYLRFHYDPNYGSEQYVILPYVDDIAEVDLWFYAKALTENAAIWIGVMTDPNDVNTFETAFEIDNLTSDYQQFNISFDPDDINDQVHYIAIKSVANNGAVQCDLCIDNLELLRITQMNLTLSEGWNWWTPTVRTYRHVLQAALGSNGIVINSQNQGFQKYNGNYWNGTLPNVLEPGQMYKIKTNAAVSATLQGLEVGQTTITIVPGYNWFGYTGAQATDIATALDILGISPTDGDIITDKDGHIATYTGNNWDGTLTTLQPGHGYVYLRQQ